MIKKLALILPGILDPRTWRGGEIAWIDKEQLGKYPIGLGVKPELVAEFVQTGSPIAGIMPAEGSYTTIGGGSVALIKNAPHPKCSYSIYQLAAY